MELRRSLGLRHAGSSGIPRARTRLAHVLRERPAVLAITLVVGAVTWALLEQLLTAATGGWSWVAFAQGAMRNASFALLLSCVAMLGRADRLHRIAPADTDRPGVSTEELVHKLSGVSDVADELGLIEAAGLGASEDAVDVLDSIRWTLAHYVLRGDRNRRMMNVPVVVETIADGGPPSSELSAAARQLHASADELASRVRHTNVVIADWLVAHRVAPVNPHYLDSNALYDRYRRGEFDPASVAEDPLYVFVCHLTDVLAEFECVAAPDCAASHVLAALTLPLRAVRYELTAAVAYGTAAADVTRVATSPRSSCPPAP